MLESSNVDHGGLPTSRDTQSIPTRDSDPSRQSDDIIQADQAAAALAADVNKQPDSSGKRRRRSSLIGALDTTLRGGSDKVSGSAIPDRRASQSVGPEESKLKHDREDDDISTSEDVELEDLSDDGDDEETGLTGKDRRQSRRRRNSSLGDRIGGAEAVTAEEKKEADVHVLRNMLINCSLIGLWYCFSLSISLYNKWMFSPEHLNFHFPLFTTCGHMLVQFTLSSLVLLFLPQFRPRHDSLSNPHNHPAEVTESIQQEINNEKKPLMTRFFYLTRIGPCGMATGLDIGLGNMSLKYISLTFYTMCKSSSLAFVLLFAFAFRLESPSWRLVAIISTMTLGVVMMVFGEVSFSILGFILVISAAFFSGFRWALTQILLLRNPATSNPFSSIFFLAPVMFVSLFVIAVPVEGFPALFKGLEILVEKKGAIVGPLILIFPGIIAFLMTASEFALLQRTSVVTLSIAGIFKEVVTISAAGLVFGDALTPINISGLVVTIGAIAAYNWIKINKMREEALKRVMLGTVEEADEGSDGEEEDWNTVEGTYVTADGDIAPIPRSGRKKKQSTEVSKDLGVEGESLLGTGGGSSSNAER